MRFQTPLVPATLIRRYKRFLADAVLDDGAEVTAHCPNPGSMMSLAHPGARIWLEPNDDPKRKLKYAWRLEELDDGVSGIDATLPNRIVAEALAANAIPELAGYRTIRPEVMYGTNSRVDFLLTGAGRRDTYVEVKNVHLRREGDLAEFPDSVTARGTKHLGELAKVVDDGARAVLLYVVQRSDCSRLALAADIDPAYAKAAAAAKAAGVEMLCFGTVIDTSGVTLSGQLPID